MPPMTHETTAPQIDRKAEAESFDLSFLLLWPVLLFHAMLEAFGGHAERLKARRRKPMPKGWRETIPDLILCEWHIRTFTAFGVERLLAGKEINLWEVVYDWTPPADLQIPHPASAWENHRRYEGVAHFHADPEAFIRRAARRIAAASAKRVFGLEVEPPSPEAAAPGTCIPSASLDLRTDERIRAPP